MAHWHALEVEGLEDASIAVLYALLDVSPTCVVRRQDGCWVIVLSIIALVELLRPSGLVHTLHTVEANAHSLLVAQLWDWHEELGTLTADGSATLTTVVLSLEKAEFDLANVALVDLFERPKGSLGNFQIAYPLLEGAFADIAFGRRHAHHTDS